ncbi:hypothetical protein Tco_0919148 [Tanacetum coccineum]
MALTSFHSALSALEFDTFCNNYEIGSEFGPELPGPNDSIRDFPEGKINVYIRFFEFSNFRLHLSTFLLRVLSHFWIHISQLSVLGAARISHFEISCLTYGRVPTTHLFHRFYLASNLPTGWITIENKREKRTLSYLLVPNPFDVVCVEKKLSENEKPIHEQTADVVTSSFDQIVSLGHVLLDQVFPTAALPPPTNVRKRTPMQAPAGESASKKGNSMGLFDDPPPITASKAGEFIPSISTATPKRLFVQSKKSSAPRKPFVQERRSSKTSTSLSSTSTHSESLVSARPEPQSEPMCHHILRIIYDPMKDFAETPREDRFDASISVDPSIAKDIYHPDWELTNDFIMDKGLLCHSFIDHLATPGLEHSELVRSELERRFSSCDARKFDERVAALDARLGKKVKETDEEFAPMLRDTRETKKFVVGNGFRYFLNKFKESKLLGSRLGACIFIAISDGMRQGLEVGVMHGKKGTEINSIPAYKPNASESFPCLKDLLVLGVHESIQDEAGTSTNLVSSSTSVGGATEQFIIAPNIPYAGDAGAPVKDVTPVDEVVIVESNDVPAGTASNPTASDVPASGPSTLVIPTASPFK